MVRFWADNTLQAFLFNSQFEVLMANGYLGHRYGRSQSHLREFTLVGQAVSGCADDLQ
jgi:hypothetical protein